MDVQTQNHLKALSIFLIALAAISLPADLPYGAIVAVVLAFLGALGYATAHYLADPTTVAADVNDVLRGLTVAIQDLKRATVIQPPIDKNQLAVDVLQIMSQLATKVQPSASVAPTLPAA